jgi:hypothetical protein
MPSIGPQRGQTVHVASPVARFAPGNDEPQVMHVNSVTHERIKKSSDPMNVSAPHSGSQRKCVKL